MKWISKLLGIDKQNEKIDSLISIMSDKFEKLSRNNNLEYLNLERKLASLEKRIDDIAKNNLDEIAKINTLLNSNLDRKLDTFKENINNISKNNLEEISKVKSSLSSELDEKLEMFKEKINTISLINSNEINSVQEKVELLRVQILPQEFKDGYKLTDPIDPSKTLFSFNFNQIANLKRREISSNTESFLRNLGSTFPELVSNGLLMKSYRFTFPQGISGKVMNMANGQGTAIMQSGKIVGHGGYFSNLAIGAPLFVISVGSMLIRQHYLSKINDSLKMINLKVSQLLELEFIKKHSKVESIIYFLEKAYNEFPLIENNIGHRNAILTNIVKINIEIIELIHFYKGSLKFSDKDEPSNIELNLIYFFTLHKLFNQGKLLEFKYSMEYNEMLISNLKESFESINSDSLKFLDENQKTISENITNMTCNLSCIDWFLGEYAKKQKNIEKLTNTNEIINHFKNVQNEIVNGTIKELDEIKYNITRKQDFLIEDGVLYEVLE